MVSTPSPAIPRPAPSEMAEPSSTLQSTRKFALGKSVASMGIATAFDLFAQFAIPIVLVRLLDDTEFGLYRTLWLIAGTVPTLFALNLPQSLYYLLPRSDRERSSAFVATAALHMGVTGLLSGGVAALFLWLQGDAHPLGSPAVAFVIVWVSASLLDHLYVAQQRIPIQAKINLAFTSLRVASILSTAWVWRSWEAVLAAHVALSVLKAGACAIAVRRYVGVGRPTRDTLREQYGYALPVGISAALYLVRIRLDQWLVASLFTAAQFGLYSIAAVFSPLQTLLRITVNQVIQPELSRLESHRDLGGMRSLNQRTTLAVTMLLFPSIAFIMVWVEPILSVLFTDRYSGAAPFVRMYLLVMGIEAFEIAILLVSMGHGRFVMQVDAIVLPVSIGTALLGSKLFGLVGMPAGAVVGAIVAQVLLYRRFALLSGIRVRDAHEWSAIARIVASSGLAAAGSAATGTIGMPGGTIGRLALAAIAFVVAYRIGLSLFGLGSKVRGALGERLARLLGFGRAGA
jgi:O-antigen/teichoic acid export membrane protein